MGLLLNQLRISQSSRDTSWVDRNDRGRLGELPMTGGKTRQ